jgi:hypothetical protein
MPLKGYKFLEMKALELSSDRNLAILTSISITLLESHSTLCVGRRAYDYCVPLSQG